MAPIKTSFIHGEGSDVGGSSGTGRGNIPHIDRGNLDPNSNGTGGGGTQGNSGSFQESYVEDNGNTDGFT